MNQLFSKNPSLIFREPHILAVYLFGSQTAKNTATPESDYDLAVFGDNIENVNLRSLLKSVNSFFLYPEKLHLTLVDTIHSSPIILYQIIKNGRLIYESSPRAHISLESRVMRLYFDDQYRSNIYYQSLKKQYAH